MTLTLTKSAARTLASQYAKGDNGIVYATDNDYIWTTDAYSAIRAKIPPNTPSAPVCEARPDMTSILSRIEPGEPMTKEHQDDDGYRTLSGGGRTSKVSTYYYKNMVKALPHAQVFVTASLAPVVFQQWGEIVGLLMPVRS